jgi:hypothetical protein
VDGVRCDGTPAAAAGGADMDDGLRTLEARACGAWPLPGDPTCASIARRAFRRVAGALALDPEVADDGMTMVSELAANTLHARREQRQQGEQRSVTPELWLYLRGAYPSRELVCKVFDACPGWLDGNVPGRGPHPAPADATSGRGLEVVHELSQGRWGYHMTRARLGGWQVRGKAVWFAVPAAPTAVRAPQAPARMSASAAMTQFQEALAARGFAGQMLRADDPAEDMAVLSVCRGLSLWCCGGVARLRAPGVGNSQWPYGDLVEVAEKAVEAYESLAVATEPQAARGRYQARCVTAR